MTLRQRKKVKLASIREVNEESKKVSRLWIMARVCGSVSICGLFFLIFYFKRDPPSPIYFSSDRDELRISGSMCPNQCRMNVPCAEGTYVPFREGCHPRTDEWGTCARIIQSYFATEQEVKRLVEIAERGMANRDADGGPTILDINGGFLRDADGIVNIYAENEALYTNEEFRLYGDVVERIRAYVQRSFGLEYLYFTAPTFITRLVGNDSWIPKSIHDEYYHMHVDKESTQHYDYSGLLYLSEYGVDFEGGLFRMDQPPLEIEPKPGLLLSFSAGNENRHQVTKVVSGTRYCLSFWFTCDERRKFKKFLDGKAHNLFEKRFPTA